MDITSRNEFVWKALGPLYDRTLCVISVCRANALISYVDVLREYNFAMMTSIEKERTSNRELNVDIAHLRATRVIFLVSWGIAC